MKTALVLSGGGSRGAYEIGVCKALEELNITYDMVYGTSVGAITGALLAQGSLSLAEDLWLGLSTDKVFDIDPDSDIPSGKFHDIAEKIRLKMEDVDIGGMPALEAASYLKEIVTRGGAGNSGLSRMIDKFIDEDRVRNSSIHFGLVTTEFPDMTGHYMDVDSIPKGQLAEYILASASCFPAVEIKEIGDKRYVDGGYYDNMPVAMALERGAQRIIAVNLKAAGITRHEDIKKARETCHDFHYIKPNADLGNFLVFDRDFIQHLIRVGYLDTLRHFGKFDGKKYTFKKGVFDKTEIDSAERIASAFSMNPAIIYDRESFTTELLAVYPHRRSLARLI